jgi:hypothetical protein
MAMFDGTEMGIEITPDQGKKKVKKFKANRKKGEVKAHYFSRAVLERLLSDPNAMGIRVYTGNDEKDELDNFVVAVNADGENIFMGSFTPTGDGIMPVSGSRIYASAAPCPPRCPPKTNDFI